ncbi:unnamed protein product [Psylliodes chrysocephalus]|uniref:Uncharacterized protein n=1 Tax=Psylliodes chrysocephalus TaxID=3402493 RepID=A0A9P0CXN8_9CUCU|nr:unnamed protein product [Psylliodes chrysocephala]
MSWSLKEVNQKNVKKFNTSLFTYQFLYDETNPKIGGSLHTNLSNILETTLSKAKVQSHYSDGDKIRLIAQNPKFNSSISTQFDSNLNFGKLLDQIENILTSNHDVNLEQTTFDIQIFKTPKN